MTATIYRMVTPESTCPSGLKAKQLLEAHGIAFEDKQLTSRPEIDAFKRQHGVETTPQIWIDDERIGGLEALKAHFGEASDQTKSASYTPVIMLFALTACMAMASSYAMFGTVFTIRGIELFVAYSMCALALQKLRDLDSFAAEFSTYDLLAPHWKPYSKIYPFAEAFAGILMIAGAFSFISIPVMFFIGAIGAVSIYKAVYLDKAELRCACVGGDSAVPLGAVSLAENVVMVLMAIWMIVK